MPTVVGAAGAGRACSGGSRRGADRARPAAVVAPAVVVPTPEPVAEQPESSPADSTDAKTPFWKKELSVKRGPKAAEGTEGSQGAEGEGGQGTEEAEGTEGGQGPKETQPPFWKRELSFGKSKAKRRRQAAEAGQASREAAEGEAAAVLEARALVRQEQGRSRRAGRQGAEGQARQGPEAPRRQEAEGSRAGQGRARRAEDRRVADRGGAGRQLERLAAAPAGRARIDSPDGVVVGGELRDIEGLAAALKELFAKHKLPKRGVRLGIANNRIGVRTFEITGIDDPRQLANAIRFRAQETLPIPLEEAVLDWQVLSEHVDEESGQARQARAARRRLPRARRPLRRSRASKAGIKLAGIDLEAFAMLRALSAPPAADAPEPTGAQVVVNVGHDRSTFAVSDGRVCEFTRVLGWGGQSLSVAIARALDMTPSEATPIKHALSLVATYAPPEGVSVEAMNTARDAVNRELQSFARELVSSLRFYQNQPGSLGIGELVLTGGTAHLPGFADELNRLIGVRVRVGDPLNRVVIPKKFREPDEYSLGSLTVAIGLGIED